MNLVESFREWMTKKPQSLTTKESTEELGRLIKEIRSESQAMQKNIQQLQQADLLRALVISMNRGAS